MALNAKSDLNVRGVIPAKWTGLGARKHNPGTTSSSGLLFNSRAVKYFLSVILLGAVCILINTLAHAQDSDSARDQEPRTRSESETTATDLPFAECSPQSTTTTQPPEENKAQSRGSLIVAPLPISSPAVGSGIIPVFAYIFQLRSKDTFSPASLVAAAGLITDNGSRAFGLAGQFFLKKNTYRITAAFVHGNLNYDLYGIGVLAANASLKIPLQQTGEVFFGEVLRRIGWKFFLGPRFLTGHSDVTLRSGNDGTATVVPDLALRTALTAIGFRLNRDTRPNRYYPTTGTLIDLTSDFFSQGLGSKYSFQSYRFVFNKYGSLSDKQVLAYNLFLCATGGQPPFYGNCIYGANNELRGYVAGSYLDRFMVATQLEYRLTLPKRFGLVGFGGIGEAIPGNSRFRTDHFLPGIGTGLRFELSKKYHVNLRADVARGTDGHTWIMGIGEAF